MSQQIVELVPIDIREFDVTILGVTPLIVHRFSEKAKKQIEDKQQKKAKGARGARDPHAEYLASLYPMPGYESRIGEKDCEYGVPAVWIKLAAVSACRFIEGLKMTLARGAFHVLGDDGGLLRLTHDGIRMREDAVTIGMGTRDMRYRAEFKNWSVKARIRYDAAVITPAQIINLIQHAGFSGGLGEMRPSQKASDQYGMFEVLTEGDHITENQQLLERSLPKLKKG